ncbi:hypothetical protein FRB95_002409, partial [Tulasnella sp. JGI-2019a]
CVHTHIAELAQCFNAYAPIHRLPNELLVKIFALMLSPDCYDLRPNPYCLTMLGLVSKDWNSVICEVPSLWAQISSNYSDRENRVAVLRLKEHPLYIQYISGSLSAWDQDKTALLNLASREVHRWQSANLVLYSDCMMALLHHFASSSVPNLEVLKIDCTRLQEQPNSIDIFSRGADRLRHVDLRNFPIPWKSRILSRLETLKISEWPCNYRGPSTSEIMDIFC